MQTANGERVDVTKASIVDISPSIQFKNCLLIPSSTHKLLSVSQLTKELNCIILMTYDGCIVQDALTGTIIGRSTERGGLYYVDETTQNGQILLTRGSPEYYLWMWHRRLGHPSLAYLKIYFLHLEIVLYLLIVKHTS